MRPIFIPVTSLVRNLNSYVSNHYITYLADLCFLLHLNEPLPWCQISLVMCWAGPQALRPPGQALSRPGQALSIGLASEVVLGPGLGPEPRPAVIM